MKGSPGDGDIGLADVGAAELFPAAAVLGGDGRGGVVLRRMALLVGPASVCLGPLLWVAGPCRHSVHAWLGPCDGDEAWETVWSCCWRGRVRAWGTSCGLVGRGWGVRLSRLSGRRRSGVGCSSCCYRQWCLRGGACNPGWVVDVVPLSRAVLLGLGDDGMLGGLNAGVAWGEPARDCCGLRGGQGDAALLEKLLFVVCLFVCLFFTKGVQTRTKLKNKALRHNAASHV